MCLDTVIERYDTRTPEQLFNDAKAASARARFLAAMKQAGGVRNAERVLATYFRLERLNEGKD